VIGPTPLLDFFKRGEVSRDVRLSAARGELAPRAHEQLAILMLLVDDAEPEVRDVANATLQKIAPETLRKFLSRSDTPAAILDFFAGRGVRPDGVVQATDEDDDSPLIDDESVPELDEAALKASSQREKEEAADDEAIDPELGESKDAEGHRLGAAQMLAKMNMMGRLKAAVKGTREMRAILIRDPNKMISAAVLSSPKLNDAEIASFAKMQNVSEDVLRIIANNRAWTKSYTVIYALVKNPKTPVAQSMTFLARLSAKDISMLSVDRNVPEPIRVAAKKRAAANRMGG